MFNHSEGMEGARESLKKPEALINLKDLKAGLKFARSLIDKPTDDQTITGIAEKYSQQIQKGKCKFLAIKNEVGELAATGCMLDTKCLPNHDTYGPNSVMLQDQAVSSEFQGKKNLGKEITDARLKTAKDMGYEYACTEIGQTNYKSLISKFKDGFVANRFDKNEDPPSNGCFLLRKRTDQTEEYDKKDGPIGELKEVKISDSETIFNLIEDDNWVGIDIKNAGDITDKDPSNWLLILEKNIPDKNNAEKV